MDTTNPQRRYAYKKNGLFAETESPDSPVMNNRSTLPAIRGPTPNYYDPIPQQSQVLAIPTKYSPISYNNNSMDISISTQQRVQQLESRILLTENSNRALIEEVARLQNEILNSARRNYDSLQEERMARQQFETSYRFQYENFMQMSNRLARAEESIQDGRNTVQSLIMQTKSLEQNISSQQKDLIGRKDVVQVGRLDELKVQIDDLQRSKENLERSAYSLIDEIKTLKSKVDIESLNFNALTTDLRNKTRRLEEENRQQVERFRKQQDTVTSTESNIFHVKSQFENRLNELKELTNELRSKIDREKEERRNTEHHFNTRYDELSKQINDDRLKFSEISRSIELVKRESSQNLDSERLKINLLIKDTKDSMLMQANDRLEKFKDDMIIRFRDLDKLQDGESEQTKKNDNNKKAFDEEIKTFKNEMRDGVQRNTDAIKRLNEGLDLIEQNNQQSVRQLEKVVLAEIKLRKQCDRDFDERLESQNEKFSYAMSSFQETLGSFQVRLNEQKDVNINQKKIEELEVKCETIQNKLDTLENMPLPIVNTNEGGPSLQEIQNSLDEMLNIRLKNLNETVFKIQNVHLENIDTKLSQAVNKDQLASFKHEFESQVEDILQQLIKYNKKEFKDDINSIEDKLSKIKIDIENMNERINKKMSDTGKEKSDPNLPWKANVDDNLEKFKKFQQITEDELNSIDAKLNILKDENKKLIDTEMRKRVEEINKLKVEIEQSSKNRRLSN